MGEGIILPIKQSYSNRNLIQTYSFPKEYSIFYRIFKSYFSLIQILLNYKFLLKVLSLISVGNIEHYIQKIIFPLESLPDR